MPKKPEKSQEQKAAATENDVLRTLLNTPPEPQKNIPKKKKAKK
jgi:hypothetical protein